MSRTVRGERAQVLPIVALLAVVLMGMVGLALDVGRLYLARAELSRAVDAAALAGVLDLPDEAQAEARAASYIEANAPGAEVTFPVTNSDNEFRVTARRDVNLLFMSVLGFDSVPVSANAAAGFGRVRSDTFVVLDATGSMGDSPCNGAQSNSGCPIKEAKDAANQFVDTILGGASPGYAKVGFAPYRGCYNPPRTYSKCVPGSTVVDLNTSASVLHTGINATKSEGGTGTNVCLGLLKAFQSLDGTNKTAGENVVRSLVILTDGDNNYNSVAYGQGEPPAACRPSNPSGSDGGSGCSSAQTRERELDVKTLDLANQIKAQGIQVYVVAFGVCATDNNSKLSDPGYCNGVGNSDHDNAADRRLLKCISSSTPGTEDHYYEVETATDLPAVFNAIARAIGFRLTE